MATAIYLSVSSTKAATRITCLSSSSNPQPPPTASTRPTKIILPKKKPAKWSTGVAPGDYGGPPTSFEPRKYWGGDNTDPLTSDEYIWNKDFMGRMKKLIDNSPDVQPSPKTEEQSSGFLNLNRVMSLDSMDVDLSKELTQPSKPQLDQPPVVAALGKRNSSPKWRLAPTRREQEKWDRATEAATGGSDVMLRELRKSRGDPEVLAAQSREQYFKLKKKLQILTLGIGGVGLVSSYISYSPEIALSFGAGWMGSLVYMRMLGSSVDSLADGARGLLKGAIAQPRLLVPVVLVMVFNRWNSILVPNYGYMHLELIPMLVGLFTYKLATFVQVIEEGISTVSEKGKT